MKTINFNELTIKNFFSIGNEPVVIHFKTGLNIITGTNLDKPDRQNGIGKSSIVDSVYFALYGESLRKVDRLDQICNYRTKKPTEVRLTFSITENNTTSNIEIIRGLKPSKVQIFIDNEDKTLDSIANNNLLIVKLLQYDSETFKNCISMSLNNSDPFMLKKKQQKREFIESIFNLGIFSKLLVNAKARHSTTSKDHDIEATRFDEITRNILLYNNQKQTAEKEKQTKLLTLNSKIETNNTNIELFTKKIEELQQTNFEEKYQLIDDKSASIKKAITNYRFKVEQNVKDIATANTKININTTRLSEFPTVIGTRKDWLDAISVVDEQLKLSNAKLIELKKIDFKKEKSSIETQKEGIKSEISKLEVAKSEINKRITENTTRQGIDKKNLETISKQLGSCPTCKRAFDIHDKDILENEKKTLHDNIQNISNSILTDSNEINNITLLINSSNTLLQSLDNQIKYFQDREADIVKINNEIQEMMLHKQPYLKSIDNEDTYNKILGDNLAESGRIVVYNTDLGENKTKITQLEAELVEISNERKDVDKLKESIVQYQEGINTLRAQIDQFKSNIADLDNSTDQFTQLITDAETRKQTASALIEKFKNELQLLDQAKFVFSEEGVKSFLIKKTLDLFNNRLAYYLKQLDSKYMCFFNEYFEEEVLNSLGETYSYFNLSGAERKAIDFACLFTFMDIRRLQGDVSVNISFYDELLDSSLDTVGIETVLNVLRERIEKYNESMFVISHRKESAKFATGEVIYLQLQNEITTRIDYSNV